ncbi:MAG TPA: hypothetical protein VIL13_09310 [Longimicrobiales bacterium]
MLVLGRVAPVAWLATGLTALVVGACGSRSADVPRVDGLAPALVVERFLQAANSDDLETMARLFGTREGSILKRDPRPDVERRMYALASYLRHKDFKVEGERPVPGRLGEAVWVLVRLDLGRRQVVTPFTVLRSVDGWLIEQFDLEAIARER